MTKVDPTLDAVTEAARDMATSCDRLDAAHFKQELLRRVNAEKARAKANEDASYDDGAVNEQK